jgi:Protein of unknown function (DUF3017)
MTPRIARQFKEQTSFTLVVLALLSAFGYLVVAPGHWRRATGVMAVAMLLAGVLRLAVPSTYAGLLAVRGRGLDAVCYLLLGGVILGVALRLH